MGIRCISAIVLEEQHGTWRLRKDVSDLREEHVCLFLSPLTHNLNNNKLTKKKQRVTLLTLSIIPRAPVDSRLGHGDLGCGLALHRRLGMSWLFYSMEASMGRVEKRKRALDGARHETDVRVSIKWTWTVGRRELSIARHLQRVSTEKGCPNISSESSIAAHVFYKHR